MKPTALAIIKEVAEAYGVTTDDLRSKSRIARFADARAVACYLLHRHTTMSTTEIGMWLHRDHSSVLHSIRKVEAFNLWPTMYAIDLNIIKNIKQKLFSDGKTMD